MGKNIKSLLWLGQLLCIFVTYFSFSNIQAATPPFWKDAGYIYAANQTPIRKILEDFSDQFGIALQVNPAVKGTINGRIASNNAVEFLDRLALMRKFRWFVYANTLYVMPLNDNVVEKINVTTESSSDAKQALIGIGLFESRFGWGELQDEQAIIVSGPTEYVKLVKKVLGKADARKIESDIMIFKLKYANADDREIQYRNKVVVTPGVATILRNLLQDKRTKGSSTDLGGLLKNPYGNGYGGNANSSGGLSPNPNTNNASNNRPPQSPFSFLSGDNGGGQTSVALDQLAANPAPQNYMSGFNLSGQPNSGGGKGDKNRVPLVEADTRMNAVIIRDDSSKKEYYQALINEFDQQPKMVEIEAMIIDVNRSKMKDLGIDWTIKSGKNSIGVSAVATSSLDVANTSLGAGSSILVQNLQNFYGRIRALEQDGEAYILAKPSVLTIDNLGAVLDLNRTAYIRLIGERVADVMPVTAGTMLKVTPRVIMEGNNQRIHLVVDIEDGELQEAEGSATPSVQRSTISTQAIIEENQALVIGGYQSQTDSRTKQRIPVLGDIPYIGGLFVRSQKSNSNKERIFVIVPRAITRNYKRTYGNNVEGTPLPPSTPGIPTLPFTMQNSSNGLGTIVYAPEQSTQHNVSNINKTLNKINNINSVNLNSQNNSNNSLNLVKPPSNPFTASANTAPPTKANIQTQQIRIPVNKNNTNGANLGSTINNTNINSNYIPINNNPKNPKNSIGIINPNINNNSPPSVRNVSYLLQGQGNNIQTNVKNANNTNANGLQLSSQLSIVPKSKASNNDKFLTER